MSTLSAHRRVTLKQLILSIAISVSALMTLSALLGSPPARANDEGGPAASTQVIAITSPSTVTEVSIINLAFEPQVVTITVDSSVRWTNADMVTHTTTSDTGIWDSLDLGPGGTFTETFDTLGVYAYHCNIHSQMRGTVVVLRNLYLPVVLRSFGP